MIGQHHESESLGVVRWLMVAIAIGLAILLMYFAPEHGPPLIR